MAAFVALLMIGLCKEDIKPFGPDQLYIPDSEFVADRIKLFPAQIGPLEFIKNGGHCAKLIGI